MPKRTPLFETHLQLGARIVEFGGWDMPIQYSGILDEHKAVRTAAGMFDISHMGEVFVEGAAAEAFLNSVLTNDLRKLEPGQGQYTLLCNKEGGVIDDLFAYRLPTGGFLLIVNASRTDDDLRWLRAALGQFPDRDAVRLTDATDSMSALALQGPRVAGFIDTVFRVEPGKTPISQLKRNRIAAADFRGVPVWIARTGYTGEDGFEIVVPNGAAVELWNALMSAGGAHGLKACGLGARDTLRTEMCFPLYGHELTESLTPLDAGLDVFVSLDKPAFNGRDVLLSQKRDGLRRRLVAFQLTGPGAPPPRPHYPVWDAAENGSQLGETTSGTLSPSLGVGIGMAYVPSAVAEPGRTVFLEIRGRRYPAELRKKPLYRRPEAPK